MSLELLPAWCLLPPWSDHRGFLVLLLLVPEFSQEMRGLSEGTEKNNPQPTWFFHFLLQLCKKNLPWGPFWAGVSVVTHVLFAPAIRKIQKDDGRLV